MKYKSVTKANPQDRDITPVYYTVSVNYGVLNLKQVARDISEKSSLAIGDILSVLCRFISDLLKRTTGRIKVFPGDSGSFMISFDKERVDGPGTFNPAVMIRRKSIPVPVKSFLGNLYPGLTVFREIYLKACFCTKNTVRLHPKHSAFVLKTQCVCT